MKKIILLLIFPFLLNATPGGRLSGYVKDKNKGEPLPYVNLVLTGSDFGSATNVQGYYVIQNIPPGNYTLKVMMMGYETYEEKIIISENSQHRKDFDLEVQALESDAVIVTADRTRFENKVEVSRIHLSMREIKMAPAFIESDIFRSLQLLPGITAQNDFSSALIVRGGSPDENLILLDGSEIYNPYHIGGVFSTFNADAISGAEFLAGGFPAEYGGRISSVLEITTKNGDSKNGKITKGTFLEPYWDLSRIKGEINILSSKILAEGYSYKGSWILSARRTYFDKLASLYYSYKGDEQDWEYYFKDIQFKTHLDLNDKHRFTYSTFGGDDVLNFSLEPNSVNAINFDWGWGNRTSSFIWRYVPNSYIFSEFTFSKTKYAFDVNLQMTQVDSLNEQSLIEVMINNTVSDYTFHEKLNIYLSEAHHLTLGMDIKQMALDFNYSIDDVDFFDISQSPTIAEAYIQDRWKVNILLSILGGIRISKYSLHDKYYFQPRLGIKYSLTENTKINISGGYYNQFIFTTNDDNEILRVVDFWEPVPEYLGAESAYHYIFGIEQWLGNSFTGSLEAYYKPYDNVLDTNPDNDPFDQDDDFISGTGQAYGIELLLKKTEGKVTGWLGYSYSRVEKKMDLNSSGDIEEELGERYYLKYDTPHRLNLVVNYRFKKKNTFNLTFTYNSGQLYTPVVGKIYHQSSWGDLYYPYSNLDNIYGDKNSARYPYYLRGDIGWVRKINWFGIDGNFKFQVINFTNHINVLLYNWNHERSPSEVKAYSMFPVIPSFGVEFEL